MNIPELPIQVVAVTDAPATNYHHTQELNQVLVAEVKIIIDLFYHLLFPLLFFDLPTSWYTGHLYFVKIFN